MSILKPMLDELEHESRATRRVLERVPQEHLEWRPHETSMTLGQLAMHVAGTPGAIAQLMAMDEVGLPEFGKNPQPGTTAEIMSALDESLAGARSTLGEMDDAWAMTTWRMVHGGDELMAMPRAALARAIMLNHWYHHRGQLCVYLRMLGVPVPAVYGASRDENPFLA